MELIKIFAKDVELHDVLGEGQEVWAMAKNTPPEDGVVQVYFGSRALGHADFNMKAEYNPFDLINVLRGGE